MALGVERDCLVEKVSPAVDERVCPFFTREGKLVVDDLGGNGHKVEGAVGIGLGKRVPITGKATAKVRERLGGGYGVPLGQRLRIA